VIDSKAIGLPVKIKAIAMVCSILGAVGVVDLFWDWFYGHPLSLSVAGLSLYLFPEITVRTANSTVYINLLFVGLILGPLVWIRDASSRAMLVWFSLAWAIQVGIALVGSLLRFTEGIGGIVLGLVLEFTWAAYLAYFVWQYNVLRSPPAKGLFT
jgi:hypothetical protein